MKKYVLIDAVEGQSLKRTYKDLVQAEHEDFKKYSRYVMPRGKVLHTKEEAFEFMLSDSYEKTKKPRLGTCIVIIIQGNPNNQYLFYINSDYSEPKGE